MSNLDRATELAKNERKHRRGRTPYSEELKDAIRGAASEHSRSEISKRTGISYPTIIKILGSKRRRRVAKPRSRSVGKQAPRSSAVSVLIKVSLPSGNELSYSEVQALRADARTLASAASSIS